MPKPEKNAIDRLATIRSHPLRRQILQAAEEAHAMGRLVSPSGLHKQLKAPMGSMSYHVQVLKAEGALKLLDTVPRRGASEHLYGINEDLLAEIQDSVALDQIAEALENEDFTASQNRVTIAEIVRSTGRPVEA